MEINQEFQDFEKDSVFKKIFIGILSIFLLFLFLSYFLLSYPLFPILESLFESREAKEDLLVIEGISIKFENKTYNILQENYHKNQSVEFISCLIGEKEGSKYTINNIYTPEVIEQSFNHISFKSCSKDTLIILHSHPYRRCIASQQDILTLNNLKQENPNRLMIIMCEPNRFSIY